MKQHFPVPLNHDPQQEQRRRKRWALVGGSHGFVFWLPIGLIVLGSQSFWLVLSSFSSSSSSSSFSTPISIDVESILLLAQPKSLPSSTARTIPTNVSSTTTVASSPQRYKSNHTPEPIEATHDSTSLFHGSMNLGSSNPAENSLLSSPALQQLPMPLPWTMAPQCISLCNMTVDPTTGRFPTKVKRRMDNSTTARGRRRRRRQRQIREPPRSNSSTNTTLSPELDWMSDFVLSHESYGSLADVDFNHWHAADQLFQQRRDINNNNNPTNNHNVLVPLLEDCLPPVSIIYLYAMRNFTAQWKLIHELVMSQHHEASQQQQPQNHSSNDNNNNNSNRRHGHRPPATSRYYIILATGWVMNFSLPWMNELLQSDYVLRIYQSSIEINVHNSYQVQKLYPLPLGLLRDRRGIFDQAPPLLRRVVEQQREQQQEQKQEQQPNTVVFNPKEQEPMIGDTNKQQSHYSDAATRQDSTSLSSEQQEEYLEQHPTKPRLPSRQNRQQHSKLLLVNFSPNNFKRKFRDEPYQHCCNSSVTLELQTTCTSTGGFYDDQYGTKHFKYKDPERTWRLTQDDVYRQWSQHKYTVTPRGQKTDTYRFWESLYLGSVPIVLKSHQYYYHDLVQRYFRLSHHHHHHHVDQLPILFVDSWQNITKSYLEDQWNTRFRDLLYHDPDWQWRPVRKQMTRMAGTSLAGTNGATQNSSADVVAWLPPKYLSITYIEQDIRRLVQETFFPTQQGVGGDKNNNNLGPKRKDHPHVSNSTRNNGFWQNRRRCHSHDDPQLHEPHRQSMTFSELVAWSRHRRRQNGKKPQSKTSNSK